MLSHQLSNCLKLLMMLLISLWTISAHASSQMNGIATHNELRRDYYHGALFVDRLSNDPETLLSQSGPKKMVLHIMIDEWSPRRFSQHWNQSILINNSAETRSNYSTDITKFKDLISSPLVKGDEFVIENVPGKSTLIKLNGTTLMKAKSGFFNVVLNTWIGARPPSSDFKASILNLGTDPATKQMVTVFNNLKPSDKRKRAIASWVKPAPPKPKPAPKPAVTKTKPAAKPKPVAAKPKPTVAKTVTPKQTAKPAPKATVAAKPKPVQTPVKPKVVTQAPVNTKPVINPPKVTSKPKSVASQPAAPKTTPVAKPAPQVVAKTVSSPTTVEKTKPTVPQTKPTAPTPTKVQNVASTKPAPAKPKTGPQDGLLRVYRSNLLKLTYRHVIYPDSAIDRNQEGDVILLVVVNRKGRVKDVGFAQKASFEPLNRAAMKAVKNAGPFPAPPKKLKGDNFEIVMPIKFRLPS